MPRNPATHVGIAVKINGTEIPCDPAVPGPGILSGLKIVWGRSDRLAIPAAPSCDFEMIDTGGASRYLDLVSYDALVEVLSVAPDNTRQRVFIGYVSDITYKHDGDDAVLGITVMHPAARLSSLSMGDKPWPAQSPENREAAMRTALPAGTVFFGSNTLPDSQYRLAALDVDNRTAEDVITDYYKGLGLIPYPTMDVVTGGALAVTWDVVGPGRGVDRDYGVVDSERTSQRECVAGLMNAPDSQVTPVAVRTVILDACDIDLDGTEFRANPADSGMNVKVTYGPSDTQLTYFYEYTRGGDSRTLEVTSGVDVGDTTDSSYANLVALNWALQMPDWKYDFDAPWAVGELTVDPDTVTSMDDFHLAMIALLDDDTSGIGVNTRAHCKVMVQNLPAWTPWRRGTRTGQYGEPGEHCDHVIGVLLGGTYTFDEGRWVLALQLSIERALQSELAPPLVVVVHPGDTVPYRHDDSTVTFQPDPDTMWPLGETASFADGAYGWDGTVWVRGGTKPQYVLPGDTVDVAHDSPTVYPQPTTEWEPGTYATFTDGTYRWNGTAWATVTLVSPGEAVDVPHTDPNIAPDPDTAWDDDEYATFTDGTYTWTGNTWIYHVVPIIVTPGATVNAPHDAAGVTPDPTTRWDVDDYATFTDGRYRWDGTEWVAYIIWTTARTNLCPDPRYIGIDGKGGGGSASWTQEDVATGSSDGAGYTRIAVTSTQTGTVDIGTDDTASTPVTPGQTYTLSTHASISHQETLKISAVASWLDAAGTVISTTAPGEAAIPAPGAGWRRYPVTAVVPPDGATDVQVRLRVAIDTAPLTAGDLIFIGQRLIEEGDQLLPYMDGDYPDTEAEDFSWTADANASPSIMRVPGVTPGSVVDVRYSDTAVVANPLTPWALEDYATFTDGTRTWGGDTWLPVFVVHPGDVKTFPHDRDLVLAEPTTPWADDQYATFTDGTYRWDGTAWVVYVAPIPVAPGDVVDVAHDAEGVTPEPTTPWAADQYATFSDGTYRWDGTSWAVYVVPFPVAPYDVVDVAHDAEGVTPEPATAWGPKEYATFTDGTYTWDGTAWVAVVVAHPYEVLDVPHTEAITESNYWYVPGQSRVFAYATFTDGTWAPTVNYWAAVTVVSPGDTVTVSSTSQRTTPVAPDAWTATEYATFSDGTYRWDGTAWVAYTP